MSPFSNIHELFNDSGCLSQEALDKYIRQLLSDEDRQRVEEHLASCPLCSDAIEGLSVLEESADDLSFSVAAKESASSYSLSEKTVPFSPGIDSYSRRINTRLRGKFNYDPYRRREPRKVSFFGNFLIPAAASIIVLVGIISYFHFFFPERQELAMAEQGNTPVNKEDKDIIIETELPQATAQFVQPTIGGVANRSEDVSEFESTELPKTGNEVPPGDLNTGTIVTEEEALVEEDIILAEADDDISIARPEALDEAVVVYAAEEKEGARALEKLATSAKSRAKSDEKKSGQEVVFSQMEQMPEFPGGMDSLQVFLQKNLTYPASLDHQVDANVIVQLVINKNGKIKDITIIRSAGKAFDDEVIRVIKLMPDWTPAIQRGKPVSAKYNLPVKFIAE